MKISHGPKSIAAGLVMLALPTGGHSLTPAPGRLPVERMGQLNIDQSKETVLNLFRPPESAATRLIRYQGDWRPQEILRYQMDGRTNYFVVMFREAKIIEHGPLVGERAMDLEGVFDDRLEPGEKDPSTVEDATNESNSTN